MTTLLLLAHKMDRNPFQLVCVSGARHAQVRSREITREAETAKRKRSDFASTARLLELFTSLSPLVSAAFGGVSDALYLWTVARIMFPHPIDRFALAGAEASHRKNCSCRHG
jgi:hypothetical protein